MASRRKPSWRWPRRIRPEPFVVGAATRHHPRHLPDRLHELRARCPLVPRPDPGDPAHGYDRSAARDDDDAGGRRRILEPVDVDESLQRQRSRQSRQEIPGIARRDRPTVGREGDRVSGARRLFRGLGDVVPVRKRERRGRGGSAATRGCGANRRAREGVPPAAAPGDAGRD